MSVASPGDYNELDDFRGELAETTVTEADPLEVTDLELSAIAGAGSGTDKLFYFTGEGSGTLTTFTAFARTLLDDANAAAARTTLGLVIGTNVQAFNAALNALATNFGSADFSTVSVVFDAMELDSPLSPTSGGTGVDNALFTITLGGHLTTAGSFNTTLTVTGATNVTLPTTGILATRAGAETLTNKTLTSPVINSPTGIVKGDVGLGNVDNITEATRNAASATLTNKTIDADDNQVDGFVLLTAINPMSGSIYGYKTAVNAQTGTSYTLGASDSAKVVTLTNGSAITVTLPNNLAAGSFFKVIQGGAGQVTFTPDTGATMHNRLSHTKTAGLYAEARLYVKSNAGGASAIYNLSGDTAA